MRGQEGVIDSTMLLRGSPFGEWVVVYYRPEQISEKKIHQLIVRQGCPNASIIRSKSESTTMNPIIAAGDPVQLRVHLSKASSLSIAKIPKNWKIESSLKNLSKGENFLTVRVPRSAKKKASEIHLKDADGTVFKFPVEIVGRIPG